jgi:hypothetical protein
VRGETPGAAEARDGKGKGIRQMLMNWFKTLLSGRPHFYIGGTERPYMLRWFLIPRNPWLNVYLHKFLRDDDDRALHDHPWAFISFMLFGAYYEMTPSEWNRYGQVAFRRTWSIAFRRATHQHRVALLRDKSGQPIPCWTLVVTGPKVRTWGFWCPKGFVPWHEFVDQNDKGNVGKGCGE